LVAGATRPAVVDVALLPDADAGCCDPYAALEKASTVALPHPVARTLSRRTFTAKLRQPQPVNLTFLLPEPRAVRRDVPA